MLNKVATTTVDHHHKACRVCPESLQGLCALIAIIFCLTMIFCMPAAQAQLGAFNDPESRQSQNEILDLVPQRPTIDAGQLTVGGGKEVITLFKNEGGDPITVSKVELIPSSNISANINLNQCEVEPLEPGVECAISVSILANQPGDFEVGVLVNHTGRSRLTTASITGQIATDGQEKAPEGTEEIEADTDQISFGTTSGRSALVRAVRLKNRSSVPVNINEIKLIASRTSGFTLEEDGCEQLTRGQSCIITVEWAPKIQGPSEGVIVVKHSGSSALLNIAVSGSYDPEDVTTASIFPDPIPGMGLVIADRESVDFGGDIDGAASITVSIINDGDVPVTLKSVDLAGSDNGLSIADMGCNTGSILLPSQACPLTLNWLPRRAGPITDDIQISHTGARGVLVLPVRGEATQAAESDRILVTSTTSGASDNRSSSRGGLDDIPRLPIDEIDDNPAAAGEKSIVSQEREESNVTPPEAGNLPERKPTYELGFPSGYLASGKTKSLDGYKVTSHAADRAVISGPRGRLVVTDGQISMIAGARWIPRIVPEGVELIGESDIVLLFFDRSFDSIARSSGSGEN